MCQLQQGHLRTFSSASHLKKRLTVGITFVVKAWENVKLASQLEVGTDQGAPIWTIHLFSMYIDVTFRLWDESINARRVTADALPSIEGLPSDDISIASVPDAEFAQVVRDGIAKLQSFTRYFPTSLAPQLLRFQARLLLLTDGADAAKPLFTQGSSHVGFTRFEEAISPWLHSSALGWT